MTLTTNGTGLTSRNSKFQLVNARDLVFNSTSTYWSWNGNFKRLDNNGHLDDSVFAADFGTWKLRRLTLDDDGNIRLYSFDANARRWVITYRAVQEICTIHGSCGPNFICKSSVSGDDYNVTCTCPAGFHQVGDQCQLKTPISNQNKTKFIRLDYVNYSGGPNYSLGYQTYSLDSCRKECLAKASCLGFGYMFDGTGSCVLQVKQLLYGFWSPRTQTAMYLRVDEKEETDNSSFVGMSDLIQTVCPVNLTLPTIPHRTNTRVRHILTLCALFVVEIVLGVFFFSAFLKKYVKYRDVARTLGLELLPAGGPKRFSYAELKAATNDFSNKIGKGGFGEVYKGELSDHRQVAVKCLKNVAGGDGEFWAEVTIIARMHHLNLVRLWGFCAEKGQRILVYEYVPNGSLDKYLFRRDRAGLADRESGAVEMKPILDWSIRYRIALGVARVIAYLHEECLEWVLHCDIKPENILLGDDFCPKISDFGLAKLRKKEDMMTMSRMRGTRGYMAPEWVKNEPITSKADVYSFGMVLLEIVSGVRNIEIRGSTTDSEDWYFPGWAFDKVFKEMKVEDLLDRNIKEQYDDKTHVENVNRMIKTAMWCLQDRPEMRPTMGKVAKMLEGSVEISEPRKPTIFFISEVEDGEATSLK
uniref:non-specific serine/threonine protein kinase n=1 Tax=Kalanchoe fedtschenkoi TaxID=63787 RepID=A0A7N0TFW7_KALFE